MLTFLCIPIRTMAKQLLSNPEPYPEPCQTSKMKYFMEIVNNLKLLTFFVKHSILDV